MNLRKYKALVIEDENDIRQDLIDGLNESGEIEVVGEAFSISTAYHLITRTEADIIFLDIQLIEGSSLELLYQLKQNQITFPPVVITTGYQDFDDAKMIHNDLHEEVIIILNKPFWRQWDQNKIKIFAYLEKNRTNKYETVLEDEVIILPEGRQLTHVIPTDIISVKTGEKRLGKTVVFLNETTISCNLTLAQIMKKLPDYFIQVSRYESINSKQISFYRQTERTITLKCGYTTSIGDMFHNQLLSILKQP
ncbi:MAG: response regulator [Saprospiraceae bacterium]